MNQRQIVINGLLVNYYFHETQSNTAPTAVFLHGWRNNAKVWWPVLLPLRKHNLALYALDLPGFGQSQAPTSSAGWRLKDYAKLVAEFVKALNLTEICLVGHSFGARVAVKLASDRPELLRKLILVSSGGWRPNILRRGLVMGLAKVLRPAFALPLLRRAKPWIYHVLGADDYLAEPRLKRTFLNVIGEDLSPLFPQIKTPTFIVWGEDDKETPLVYGRRMHQLIPQSVLKIFPQAGHLSFLEKPAEFTESLLDFINKPREK